MAKAAFVLAFVSAVLSGWLVFERYGGCASCRSHESHDAAPPAAASDDRVAMLEKRLAALEGRPAIADLGSSGGAPAASGGASLARSGPAAGTIPDLEQRIAKLEESDKKTRTTIESLTNGAAAQVANDAVSIEGPTFLQSIDDAAKHLDLTPSQKSDLERIAADSKKRIDDLKKIPDEEGKTWEDAAKSTMEPIGDAATGMRVMFGDSSKLRAFREKTIPGRTESYGAAERKILADAKTQARALLTPDQATKWDKARPDAMLGGETDDAFSFITVVDSHDSTAPVPPPAISLPVPPLPAPPAK